MVLTPEEAKQMINDLVLNFTDKELEMMMTSLLILADYERDEITRVLDAPYQTGDQHFREQLPHFLKAVRATADIADIIEKLSKAHTAMIDTDRTTRIKAMAEKVKQAQKGDNSPE